MCTTYAAALLAERLRREATVERLLLVRLNPAVPYKTRGNAALAVHTDAAPDRAFELARAVVAEAAATDDDRTNPGLVVAPGDPGAVPDAAADWYDRALRDLLAPGAARDVAAAADWRVQGWQDGRGVVGALAAVGAWRAWTRDGATASYETITYRERDRWGTERDVDERSVFAAADRFYPAVWDTVDRVEREPVCVPRAPGPVLHGIRGDDAATTRECAAAVDGEPAERRETFVTNQGTDAHLADGRVADAADGRSYRLDGAVASPPDTRRGGHVFFDLADGGETLACAAFAPTGRFRDRVRALRPGDDLTVCGEVDDGTVKLEKFAVRSLRRTEPATPTCPDCGRRMESAGRDQGYRCRDCDASAPGKVVRPVERDLEVGWYEVPPVARRHVARPLVRGGFDAPTHPER